MTENILDAHDTKNPFNSSLLNDIQIFGLKCIYQHHHDATQLVASWWRFSGAMVAAWWRHGGVIVALWWRHGGVVVASWWRHGGVMVVLVYALKPMKL